MPNEGAYNNEALDRLSEKLHKERIERRKLNKVEYNEGEIACVPDYDDMCISGGAIITKSEDGKKLILETPEDNYEYEIDIQTMLECFGIGGYKS